MKKIAAAVGGFFVALISANAGAQTISTTLPHDIPTNATSPLPSGSCFAVDQGPGTDTKLCANYAIALGAVPLNGALGTPTSGNASNLTGYSISNLSGAGAGVLGFLANPTGAVPVAWISGILTAAQGGTASGFTAFTGPAGTVKTFTLPNASAKILTDAADVAVTEGGTGLSAGVSGGIPYYSGTTTMSSTAALAAGLPVIGSGAGVAPTTGTKSGNTTAFVTKDASTPAANDCAKWDAFGNITTAGAGCGVGGGGSVTTTDGTNSVASTTTQTFNPASFKIGGSAGSATIDLTSTSIDKTASGQAIVAGDAGKTVLLGAFTYTLAQAGTSGFEAGYGTCLLNSGAANATLTSTTSVFSGASGSTSLTIQPGVMACPQSDGTNYQTLLTTSTKGIAANLPLFSNGSNGLTAGTRSGNTTKVVTSTGTLTSGNCAQWDASGNAIDAGAACGGGGGSGTVTSGTASQVPRYSATGTTIAGSSILTNDNSIVTASGAFALSGTNTPTALAANQNDYNPASLSTALALRIDGGAADRTITGLAGGVDGRVIVVTNVGTSNYLTLANASASSIAANRFQTTSDIILATNASVTLRYDGTSSRWRPINRGGATPAVAAIGWVPTVNPDKLVIMTATVPTTVLDITGTVVTGVGAAAALTVYKAPSGTVCASGTAQNTGTFDANGTVATNQTLTLAGGAANTLAPGDRLCLSTADGAAFTAGTGNGGITVRVSM